MKTILNQQSLHFGLGLVHTRVRLQEQMQGVPEAYPLIKKSAGIFFIGETPSAGAVCLSYDVPKRKKQIIIEQWNSPDVSAQIDIRVDSGSTLHYVVLPTDKKVQNQMHSIDRRIHVAKNATFIFTELSAHSQDRVSQTQVTLVAKGAEATLNTAFIGQEQQTHHLINHVEIAAGYTTAAIHSYGLLQDKSRGIYRAKIVIEKGSSEAEGKQAADILLDGEAVRIDAVPELDVSHNLVQCEHGVGISQLSEESLFYAQSRGLSQDQAKKLLKKAHIERVLKDLPKGEIKKTVKKMIEKVLP